MLVYKHAEVLGNGHGQLFAQVAEGGEYRCWSLDHGDVERFRLRPYDEIVIECVPEDQFCKVVQVGFEDD